MADNVLIATTLDAGNAQHQKVVNEFLDAGGAPVAVTAATPLPVAATISTAGLATSANQSTEITALNQLHTDITTAPIPAGSNNIGNVGITGTVALPTNAAVETGGHLAALDTKLPSQGQALAAASLPVVLPAAQITTLTPPAAITGFALEAGHLASLDTKTPAQGAAVIAASSPVNIASDQVVPVSAAALPLPTGAATSANQSTEITALNQIHTDLTAPLPAGTNVIGHVITDTGSTTAVTGTVAVSAAALPLPSNAAQETGGNLAAIKADVDKIPSQGQAAMAASTPVVIASNQTAIPISAAALPLPTNAAQETGGNLATIVTNTNKIPSLGQAVKANSVPVTLASDQSPLPVSISGATTDNTALYNNTLSAAGVITGIDTTGYNSFVVQLSGAWSASVLIEGSNDNANWNTLLGLPVGEVSLKDVITGVGVFAFKCSSKFIRINVIGYTSGTITALILGRSTQGISGADALSLAMDATNNSPLYVQETATKKDGTNALIPSDAPVAVTGSANLVNSTIVQLDTTGYQSVSLQLYGTWVATIQFQTSNDGVNWFTTTGYFSTGGTPGNVTTTTVGIWVFPSLARYFRAVVNAFTSGVIQAIAYNRQLSVPILGNLSTNLSAISGTATVNAGLAGVQSVGGNTAAGIAPTSNPLSVAGVDSGGLNRRLLTDTSGKLLPVVQSTDALGTLRNLGSLSPAFGINGVASLTVSEQAQFEGQSQIEILAQILAEIRTTNILIYQMARGESPDEPMVIRNDQSLINNN